MVRRNDPPSDDSPTSYVPEVRPAGDHPTTAVNRGELPTSFIGDPEKTSIVRPDDIPTSVMRTVAPAPSPKRRSPVTVAATWGGFAVVAVGVVWATTAWAGSLRGPGDGSDNVPVLANLPTLSATPEPQAEPRVERTRAAASTPKLEERQPSRVPERTADPVAGAGASAPPPAAPPATSAPVAPTSSAPAQQTTVAPRPTTAAPTTTPRSRGGLFSPDVRDEAPASTGGTPSTSTAPVG